MQIFFLYLYILTISSILNSGSLSKISLLESLCVWFYNDRFHLNCSNWTIYPNLSIYTFFWNWGHAFINFIFKALMDLSTMTDFVHYALNTFLYHYSAKTIASTFCKIHCFIYPYFIWFANWFIWNFWKALGIVISFLCSKGSTYAYLL